MDELKPCPHCGGKAKFEQFANPKNFYSVVCTECGCETDGFKLCRSENTAQENKAANAKVWNRRAAPENKPLTLEQLRQIVDGWVWLTDAEHPKFNGWYTVRPFHGGGDRIEFWGVDNAYYELAITAGSVKVYAHKPEGSAT